MDENQFDKDGLTAARRLAGWEIGDPAWADRIITAYLNPEPTNRELDARDVPDITGTYR